MKIKVKEGSIARAKKGISKNGREYYTQEVVILGLTNEAYDPKQEYPVNLFLDAPLSPQECELDAAKLVVIRNGNLEFDRFGLRDAIIEQGISGSEPAPAAGSGGGILGKGK